MYATVRSVVGNHGLRTVSPMRTTLADAFPPLNGSSSRSSRVTPTR